MSNCLGLNKERKRESRNGEDIKTEWYEISSEPLLRSAFTKLVQDQLKTSYKFSFYMFFKFRTYTRQSFFPFGIMTTFDISKSVSSHFITLTSLFRHSSLLRASSIISRHLTILDSPWFRETISSCLSTSHESVSSRFSTLTNNVQLRPFSTLPTLAAWRKARALGDVVSRDSSISLFHSLSFSLGRKSSVDI